MESPPKISGWAQRIYVLVTAHPDDESMFFVPTIRALAAERDDYVDDAAMAAPLLWFLCLTTGDYDGLGRTRREEMMSAGELLGADRVILFDDDPASQNQRLGGGRSSDGARARRDVTPPSGSVPILDHPKQRWDLQRVADTIASLLRQHMIQHLASISPSPSSVPDSWDIVLLTFDEGGVSGHVNHLDTHLGVRYLVEHEILWDRLRLYDPPLSARVEAWQLSTETNLLRKYLPVTEWIFLIHHHFASKKTQLRPPGKSLSLLDRQRTHRLHQPALNWAAMAVHASQFVWYRRLFVIFSCYTYINLWSPIVAKPKKMGEEKWSENCERRRKMS